MKKFSSPQMKEVSFPTPHTRSDLGRSASSVERTVSLSNRRVRLRRELLSNARSNAELTAEAHTLLITVH